MGSESECSVFEPTLYYDVSVVWILNSDNNLFIFLRFAFSNKNTFFLSICIVQQQTSANNSNCGNYLSKTRRLANNLCMLTLQTWITLRSLGGFVALDMLDRSLQTCV